MNNFTPEQSAEIESLCLSAGAMLDDYNVHGLAQLGHDPQDIVDALRATVERGIRGRVTSYTKTILDSWREHGRTERPATVSFAERDRQARRDMIERVWGTERGVRVNTLLVLLSLWNTFGVKFLCAEESDVLALAMGPLGRCPDDKTALRVMTNCRAGNFMDKPSWATFENRLREHMAQDAADARRAAEHVLREEENAKPRSAESIASMRRMMARVGKRNAEVSARDGLIPKGDA